jgi:hypothetical protein
VEVEGSGEECLVANSTEGEREGVDVEKVERS